MGGWVEGKCSKERGTHVRIEKGGMACLLSDGFMG